ncbi:hypothetical protein FRB90_007251, partial [Tulasnella sp. 427]
LFSSSGMRHTRFYCSSVKMKMSPIMHLFISSGLVWEYLHTRLIMWLESTINP